MNITCIRRYKWDWISRFINEIIGKRTLNKLCQPTFSINEQITNVEWRDEKKKKKSIEIRLQIKYPQKLIKWHITDFGNEVIV